MTARTRLPCERGFVSVITPFKPTREPCLLLVLKMEMCVLTHPCLWYGLGQPLLPCTLEGIPHLGLWMGFKCSLGFLDGLQEPAGGVGWKMG